MTDPRLKPALDWFSSRNWQAFDFQKNVWSAYLDGRSGMIHASTGAGKTYAAWMGPLLDYLNSSPDLSNPVPLSVIWVTPLRALASDICSALNEPVNELKIPWTVETRTGDTSSSIKARQSRQLPSTLITTPESLTVLQAKPEWQQSFKHLKAVIVDEWHELMASKRGVQTELALSRLRTVRPDIRVWGVSATLGNLDEAMDTLLGPSVPREHRKLVSAKIGKTIRIGSLLPESVERFPWAGHLGIRQVEQVVRAIEDVESALIFTNTRSQTEIWYQAILDARPDWAGLLAVHHGSLDREVRDWVEAGIKEGRLKAVVCTSSLDLGVDFSPVELVIQIGSPKGVARLLQRAGRSGHRPGAESEIFCVPTHAFELLEVAAVRRAAKLGRIETRPAVMRPLDVLAQHMVTAAVAGGFTEDELLHEVRTTHAYRDLPEDEWRWALEFVTRGGSALASYDEFKRVGKAGDIYLIKDQKTARQHRMSIGTIASDIEMRVQYTSGESLGHVEESFIARMKPGDRFNFAGRTLELVRVKEAVAYVKRVKSSDAGVPRWGGGRMPLSSELSLSVRELLQEARDGEYASSEMLAVKPVLQLQGRWSVIPAMDELLVEKVSTREGHHIFIYPFEGRLVHEGLAALFAYRISRHSPITFTFAVNDYGLELLSPEPAPWEDAVKQGLFSTEKLLDDIPASLNAAELAKRQFREIARVAGLIFPGFPGAGKSAKQLQASSGLFYDVFVKYDPENLLLKQAHREVLERQLEAGRLSQTLSRLQRSKLVQVDLDRPTPLAFPLFVDRMREKLSSEKLADRIRRMQAALEKAAGTE